QADVQKYRYGDDFAELAEEMIDLHVVANGISKHDGAGFVLIEPGICDIANARFCKVSHAFLQARVSMRGFAKIVQIISAHVGNCSACFFAPGKSCRVGHSSSL